MPFMRSLYWTIHRGEKGGDWYFYSQLLVQKKKNAHKNAKESSNIFKPSMNNVVSTCKNFAKT